MARILLKVHQPALQPADAQTVLEQNRIGNNVGNFAFSYAAERLLTHPADEVTAAPTGPLFANPDRVNAEFDHVVFPLANHFRASNLQAIERQAAAIEKLKTRFTVLGVGAQASLAGSVPKAQREAVDRATQRFIRAALELGPSIGVRGEFTKEYLVDLGFDDSQIDIIGCPSMFMNGPDLELHVRRSLFDDEPIAVTISPYVTEMGPILKRAMKKHSKLTYIAQDHATLRLLMQGKSLPGVDPAMPIHAEHPIFSPGRTVFPLNVPTWQEFLGTRRFTFGTRIHGTIMSLVSGTPAVLLAHDSRTLELAKYHVIPHVRLDEIDPRDITVSDLFNGANWNPMVDEHGDRWDTYNAFLKRHGLRHGFGPAGGVERFDAAVAAVAYPDVVRSDAGPAPLLRRAARKVVKRR